MRWETKKKIRQNVIAYSFLLVPLLLLAVFTFYPLLQGIYISFMKFEILRRPTVGGPITFFKQFLHNLKYLDNPMISIAILLVSIGAIFWLIKAKKRLKKWIPIIVVSILIINGILLSSIFHKTLTEVNYVIKDSRTLPKAQAERYVTMLEKKYQKSGDSVEILKEPVADNRIQVATKQSIWIGLDHYKRILKNDEFFEFVKTNNWYQLLLFLTLSELIVIFILPRILKKKNRRLDLALKWLTAITLTTLVLVTWPKMFHARIWLFYQGLENSLKYLLVVIPIQFASMLLAILVNQKIKGIKLFRTLYYIPVITGIIVIGYSWKWIFNPDGLLNSVLQMLHILSPGQQIFWLSDPDLALWVVMFVTFWRGLGYYMVIYMAGLQAIPEDLIEAATIDGASKSQIITKIYFPLLRPTILLCTILSTMASLKIFEEIFVLTSGKAQTTTLVYLIYDKAFGGTEFKFGYSSALAVLLSLIIGFFTILNFKINKQGEING